MSRDYKPNHIYHEYITTLSLQDYDFIIHYAELLNGSVIEFLHYHPLYEIYYVINGNLKIFVNNKELTLEAGSILFLAPNVNHHVIYEPNNSRNYFVLIFDILSNNSSKSSALEYRAIKQELDFICKTQYIVLHNIFDLNEILDKIWMETQEQKIGWYTASNFLYHHFFIASIRHIHEKSFKQDKPPGILNLGLIASKYIHMNYQNKITIESVAEYLNITPRHVNRVFEALFGTTFSKTLKILRIEYAKNYLCNTNYSLEDIAELVGFASAQTLSENFCKVEGISITKYRSEHQAYKLSD